MANDPNDPIVIAGAARTPIGNFQGAFAGVPATDLGASAIAGAMANAGASPDDIDEVLMGCVLPAALGQAPARQAALAAGLPQKAGCTTINKVCSSGLKAVMMAYDSIRAGTNEMVVAGGMESMTRAPHMMTNARAGVRFGQAQLQDHMAYDGLEDPYHNHAPMGTFAEKCAREYQFSRETQDAYSVRSVERAQKSIADGTFAPEITAYTVSSRKGDIVVADDEKPGLIKTDKIPALRPAFEKDGTVTAGNASAISDGAAAMIVTSQSTAEAKGLKPLARILGHATHSHAPEWFTTAPVGAMKSVMDRAGWSVDDVDLFEINEAFAVVPLAAIRDLSLPDDKVNIHGGAIALGHPIGASGARILVTLINALKTTGGSRGIASLCNGGGEGTAIAIEMMA